ncbi:putative LPS assembly protein LptD [Mucilaginibacter sp. HD30]
MKFINLFFLFAIILMVSMMAAAGRTHHIINVAITDTIIHLDSTDKYPLINKRQGIPKGNPEKVNIPKDTIPLANTAKADSGLLTAKKDSSTLTDELIATAKDSTVFIGTDTIRLYGSARVKYGDFELDADFIEVDQTKKIVFARGVVDPVTGRYSGRPIIKQGTDAPITSDSLRSNYETKMGKTWNVLTQQEQNYISHGQAKKISEDEVAYHNIIFSACDKPDPDYGIVITRGIGEKKRIISGPAYLEIAGVPMPIGLPFGFFPKPDTKSSGVILPTFGEDATLGFFLRGFGYYFAINDYMDLTSTGTYYSNGSYEVTSAMNYMKRYKYNGNLSLSYGSHNYGLAGDPAATDFHINWSHSQSPNANPGRTFSASVSAGTSSFYQNNPATTGYNLQALTQNQLQSSVSYSRIWQGTPFALNVSLAHNQDLTRKTVNLELPRVTFSMSTINPFDKRDRVGEQKWYQRITVGYTLNASNSLNNIPEKELFTTTTLTKRMRNGISHQIPVALSLNVLNYFQFNTGFNYNERWYFQSIRQRYARADSLVTDTIPGFNRAGDYSLSGGFSTKIYGTKNLNIGSLRAIRHVITPTISFSYRPDYSGLNRPYNKVIVSNATVPYPVTSRRYSIFDGSLFSGPGGGTAAGVGIGIDNNVEAKVRPKSTDSVQTEKKIMLIQGLSLNTFYNFAADSFQLSNINFSGHTAIIHDRINISFGGTFDPYSSKILDSISSNRIVPVARRVNRYSWQDGRFPTLLNFSLTVGGSLNAAALKQPLNKQLPPGQTMPGVTPEQADKLALLNSDPSAYIDFKVPWNMSFNYNFSYSNSLTGSFVTNTIMVNGDVSITPKWKVQFNTNYDLQAAKLSSATSFAIYRDLHCWDLSISWLPFGYYKSYNVTLRVRSDILQALKLTKRSDYTNNGYFNRY